MKKLFLYFILATSLNYSQTVNKSLIMVHFMPWHQTPSIHDYWGWHWTMNHYNPNIIDQNGYRQIASHFYPLTGPYDSDDNLILEYQTLLMKIARIDGVIVDWYGMANYLDYGINNVSTYNTFMAIQKANLKFSIVYEDNTIKTMIANGYMRADTVLNYGKRVMNYLRDNYFNYAAYLKINNMPVLLNFGPQYFNQSSDWETLFSNLPVKPMFFTENNRLAPVATGAFPWTPMYLSDGNGILQPSALNIYLDQYYQKAAFWTNVVTTAFPGFYDIYHEAGVQNSYGFLDARNGATFKSTLYQAVMHNPDVIQIQTWNDYGEGTIVEPTVQFGTQYLEIIQATKDSIDSSSPFQKTDLQMPLQIYNARVKNKSDIKVNAVLDRVYNYIIAYQPVPAKTLLDSLLGATGIYSENNTPFDYALNQNYPNPFNPSTFIKYQIAITSLVTLKVYDIMGREIATLVNETKDAGYYETEFDAAHYAAGIYFYRLESGNYSSVKKMMILK